MSTPLLPICVLCRVELRCAKNSFAVKNGYLLWSGDRYECPECKFSVVVGCGEGQPLRECSPKRVAEAMQFKDG